MKNFALFFFFILTGYLFSQTQMPSYVPNNGLLVWYPLDTLGINDPAPNGNTSVGRDLSGNGNDWSSNGHYLYRKNRFGVSGGAMSSNSSTIQTPFIGVLGKRSRSISLWLKNEGYVDLSNLYFNYGSNTSGNGLSGQVDDGCSGIGISSNSSAITNTFVMDTNWHHIVYVFDSTSCIGNCSVDDIKIYIDGIPINTCNSTTPDLLINTINNLSFQFIFGAVAIPENLRLGFDDFGMWDRPLSHNEVLQLNKSSTSVISPSGPSSFCQGDSVTLLASGGAPYLWNTGDTTTSITISQQGAYYVSSSSNTSQADTSSIFNISIFSNPDTSVTASGPLGFCNGESLTLSAATGQLYLWNNGDTTESISVNQSGSYYAVLTTNDGCLDTTATFTAVVYSNADTSVNVSGPLDFCSYKDVTLTAAAGQSYLWSNGDTTQTSIINTAGTYSALVTTTNGCVDTTNAFTINVFADPDTSVTASGPLGFCNGESLTLSAATGQLYLWNNGDTTESISVNQSGSYYAVLTTNDGCLDTTATFTAVVYSNADTSVNVSGPLDFCSYNDVTLTAAAGQSYLWSNGDTTQTSIINTAGTYSALVTTTNGCVDTTNAFTINVFADPDTSVTASGPLGFCNGGSVTLSAAAGQLYLWNNGEPSQSLFSNTAGTYSAIVTTANGCADTTATFTTTIFTEADTSVTTSGPLNFCSYDNITLTAAAGQTYLWSNGDTTQTSIINTAGTYSALVTTTNGCVDTTNAFTINVFADPDTSVTASGPLGFCSYNNVTLTAAAGQTYLWSNGDTTQTSIINTAGTYSALVTTTNGCVDTTNAFTINVFADPDTSVNASGPLNFCSYNNVTLTAAAGQTYLWSNGDTTQAITSDSAGTFSLIITTSNGCIDTTATFTTNIFLDPDTSITASGPLNFCSYNNVTLTAAAGQTYLWSNGDTSQSTIINQTGNYFVTATTTDNCFAISDTISISVFPDAIIPQNIFVHYSNEPAFNVANGLGWTGAGSTNMLTFEADTNQTYLWKIEGGVISSGQGTDSVVITWGIPDSNAIVWLIVERGSCKDSTSLNFVISGINLDEKNSSQIKLYPNPSDGLFTIETPEHHIGSEIFVIDGVGRVIQKLQVQGSKTYIDLRKNPKGVYRVQIKSKQGIKTIHTVIQ